MFTGIIKDIGRVFKVEKKEGDKKFFISTHLKFINLTTGSSICCSGVCLTIIKRGKNKKKNFFVIAASKETLKKSNIKHWKKGSKINLENALKVSDYLSGHLVFGHIDGTIKVLSIKKQNGSLEFNFELPSWLNKYIVPKGSVCIDGVSLTVNTVNQNNFYVSIIEHTKKETTFSYAKVGDFLNVEIDMLARYVCNELK